MKTLKIAIAALALFAVAHLSVEAQVYNTVNLPFTTISGGNTNLGGLTNNTSTNLSLGWSSSTYYTNVYSFWTNTGSGSFVSVTNISTNTSTRYADFSAIGTRYVGIQFSIAASGSSASNAVITIARSLNATNFDTLDNINITNTANGATTATKVYQVDMGGFPYGRVVTFAWNSTNAAQVLTNVALLYTTPQLRQGGTY